MGILAVGDLKTVGNKIKDYPAMGDFGKEDNTVATDAFTVDTLSLPGEAGVCLLGIRNSVDDGLCRNTKEGRAESSLSRHLSRIRKPFQSSNRTKRREYKQADKE